MESSDTHSGEGEVDNNMASMTDACQIIDSLHIGLKIPPNMQPPVELHHFSIAYLPVSDQSYENPASIMIALAELNKEIEIQKKVVQYLDEAQEHAKNLYTWRSLMRLFVMGRPTLSERTDENKAALSECLKVMEPEIRKAFQLYKYHKEASKFLAGEIHKFSQSLIKGDDKGPGNNRNFYSETCLVTMGKMIGSFVALDNLICFNAAFRNDFAEYNRTLIKAKNAGVAPNNVEEDQKLGEMKMFFAQKTPLQDSLFKFLQESDQMNTGVGSGLVINFFKKLIVTCADSFSRGKFVLPSEKEDYLKIISCCLKFIMRNEKKFESNNQVYKKCFNDEERKKIVTCFKTISVLKDFGDVPIDENQLLEDINNGKGSDRQSSLHDRLGDFEREHGAVVCRVMELVRGYNLMMERAMKAYISESELEDYLDTVAEQWYDVTKRALKCLESITGAILSLYAWKLCHGKAMDNEDITGYSKVTRYNYNGEEKTDMTIAIGLAKGLQSVLIKYEEIFSFLVGRHCFARIHHVTDKVIPVLVEKIPEKHRMTTRMYLDTLVKIAKKFRNPYKNPSNLGPGNSPGTARDNKSGGKSGEKKGGHHVQTVEAEPSPTGSTGPGNTQLYMMRSMLEWLCSSDQIKLHKRAKELNQQLMAFHEETFYWSYALNLTSITPKTGDMSILWFRESYLTMEIAKTNPDPQFGLNESMPWILAEHLLESDVGAGALIEHCLIPFELYNDSAEAVLKFFRKQHLFDELEAETSLGFEQLIHWLYTHVFENTIERALFHYAVTVAPKKMEKSNLGEPRKLNCKWLLQQSNIIMLGQTINLRERMVSKLASLLREELAMVFARFRNSSYSFAYIWEMYTKIEILRVGHSFLIEDVELPDFETLIQEGKATALPENQPFFHLVIKKLESSIFPMYNFDLHSGCAYLNKDLWANLTCYTNPETMELVSPPVPEYRLKAANKKTTFCINASEYTEKLFTQVVAPLFAVKFYTICDEHYRALVNLISLEELALIVREISRIVVENFAKTEVKGMFGSQPVPSVLFTLSQLCSGMNSSECKLVATPTDSYAQIIRMHEAFCPIILYKDLDFLIEGLTEVGNAMIFLFHLEKIVKTEEARRHVASALFTNRFNQDKFINLIGRGRFMELKKMNVSKLGRNPSPETMRKIEHHANEATSLYVNVKVDLMTRSNIFNYLDLETSRIPGLLQQTLIVPEETASFFGKLLCDLQNVLINNQIFNFSDLNSEPPANVQNADPFLGLRNDKAIQFHWLWSAIVFAMAKPKPQVEEPNLTSAKSHYSDGATFSGCALVSLLGQNNRFKAFDLCSFLETIETVELAEKGKSSALRKFNLNKSEALFDIEFYLKRAEELSKINHSNLKLMESCMKSYGIKSGPMLHPKSVMTIIPAED